MENQKSWRNLQLRMFGSISLASLLYIIALLIVIYYFKDPRSLFVVCPAYIIVVNLVMFHHRKQFEYLCPNCHRTFDPSFKEFAIAGHTPRTRKLTCPHCHVKTHCLELAKTKNEINLSNSKKRLRMTSGVLAYSTELRAWSILSLARGGY